MFAGRWLMRWLGRGAAASAAALLLCGGLPATEAAAQVAAAPVPPGAARIWFYRAYEPYGPRNMAPVSLNGATVGYAQPEGGAFYRDVAPGRYLVTAGTQGQDVNQGSIIDLAPGQQGFVKIVGSNTWDTGGDNAIYSFDTFYARLMPPQVAQAEIGR